MTSFHDHYSFYRKRGPLFEDETSLPAEPPASAPVRYIAYYLPQFHAIPENDEWWGKGFTEWTNVAGGLPRYVGHYQPRSPADLGFYDLRNVDVLRRQAMLARRGGVYGFCFHHYWFSGRRLLERPLELLLANPDIDMPFCINWANESWSRRWDGSESDILIEQRYDPGDDIAYADSILPILADPRYITVDNRPVVMIYHPGVIPEPRRAIDNIRRRIVEAGLPNPLMVMPQVFGTYDPRPFGMDAAAGFPPHGTWHLKTDVRSLRLFDHDYVGQPVDYDAVSEFVLNTVGDGYPLFPGVCPSWDNEARKGRMASAVYGSTPAKYGRWLRAASSATTRSNIGDARLVFINAWNEWAEGAYLEPDRHFGYAYLAETRRALDTFALNSEPVGSVPTVYPVDAFQAIPSRYNRCIHVARRILRKIERVFR